MVRGGSYYIVEEHPVLIAVAAVGQPGLSAELHMAHRAICRVPLNSGLGYAKLLVSALVLATVWRRLSEPAPSSS